jgi:hypothetical protein
VKNDRAKIRIPRTFAAVRDVMLTILRERSVRIVDSSLELFINGRLSMGRGKDTIAMQTINTWIYWYTLEEDNRMERSGLTSVGRALPIYKTPKDMKTI